MPIDVAMQQSPEYYLSKDRGERIVSASWDTKWGLRRVRHDPPTLAEAIAAAQGLTEDVDAQVAIAAELMGVPATEVKAEMQKLAHDRRDTRIVATNARDKGMRTVIVERKASRRVLAKDPGLRASLRDTLLSKR